MSTAVAAAVEPKYAAFVALDWADQEHAWAMEVPGSGKREHGKVKQAPEAIEAWAVELATRFGGRRVAVGLEQSRGALIYALQKYAHLALYPIHPSTSSAYRTAIFPSGRKDDPVDADLLLDLLTRHRDRLHLQQLDTVETRKLQLLTENRRQLVDEQTAQTNRLTDLLKKFFPQVLDWFDELGSAIAVAFLQRWPTLAQVQQQDDETLRRFFHQHGSRSESRIDARLQEIRTAQPPIEDPAIVEPSVLMVQALLPLITAIREGIAELQDACEKVFKAHPDAGIFASFPGAGPVLAPRLLVAFGSRRDRWNHVDDFQPYTGIPPITVRSGNSKWIHFRWAAPKFLRQSFHEFAAQSITRSEWAKEFYDHQRQVNKLDHQAAVRSLAFKWQRILFACWKSQKPYEESKHQQQLLARQPAQPPSSAAGGDSTPAREVKNNQPKRSKNAKPADRRASSNSVPFQFKKVGGFSKLSDATS
jgi:transposase